MKEEGGIRHCEGSRVGEGKQKKEVLITVWGKLGT